jgi:hypothetical protein
MGWMVSEEGTVFSDSGRWLKHAKSYELFGQERQFTEAGGNRVDIEKFLFGVVFAAFSDPGNHRGNAGIEESIAVGAKAFFVQGNLKRPVDVRQGLNQEVVFREFTSGTVPNGD